MRERTGKGGNSRIKAPFSVGLLISEVLILPINNENLCTEHFLVLDSSPPRRQSSGLAPFLCILKLDWGAVFPQQFCYQWKLSSCGVTRKVIF